jgi:DNA-binding response OmpR family regulator
MEFMSPKPRARGADPVVLFVDDEAEILSALRRCFRHEPYVVFTASGAMEALEWLEKATVDLVVADERMPGMSGTDFLREARERSPRTSRAILTGYPSESLVRSGLEAGADALLYKPWDDQSLRETVRRMILRRPAGGRGEFGGERPGEDSFGLGGEG